ncbi:ase inhibitor-like, partial [Olea europaea subsp. europaea]
MSHQHRYPPFESDFCADLECCGSGYKTMWRNTLGMEGKRAKSIIENDNPLVTALIIHKGHAVLDDFCCNRVWIFINEHGKVASVPM